MTYLRFFIKKLQSFSHPLILLMFLSSLILFSCKKKDDEDPTVLVTSPSEGSYFQSGEIITVSGKARDNAGLATLVVQLRDDQGSLVRSENQGIDGTEANFTIEIPAGDLYVTTGTYELKITATDKEGNYDSEFIDIQITEAPQALKATFIMTESGGNFTLYKSDSTGVSQFFSPGNDVTKMETQARHQQVLLVKHQSGELIALDGNQGWIDFQINIPTNSFTDVSPADNQHVASLETNPHLRIYLTGGSQAATITDAAGPCRSVFQTENYIYAHESIVNPPEYRIENWDADTRSKNYSRSVSLEDAYFASAGTGKIAVAGNIPGGNGQVLILDELYLTTANSIAVPEKITAAHAAGSFLFLLTPSGVYRFSLTSHSLSGLLIGGSFSAIAYDPLLDEVWLGNSTGLLAYSSSGFYKRSVNISGNPVFIRFLYNK